MIMGISRLHCRAQWTIRFVGSCRMSPPPFIQRERESSCNMFRRLQGPVLTGSCFGVSNRPKFYREETNRWFCKRVALRNVPSFRLLGSKNIKNHSFPLPGWHCRQKKLCGGNFGTGEHLPKPPFWKPPFCEPPILVQLNKVVLSESRTPPSSSSAAW